MAFKEKFAHVSQKDHSVGFGGKFGIQKDRIDKSAAGWEYHEKVRCFPVINLVIKSTYQFCFVEGYKTLFSSRRK